MEVRLPAAARPVSELPTAARNNARSSSTHATKQPIASCGMFQWRSESSPSRKILTDARASDVPPSSAPYAASCSWREAASRCFACRCADSARSEGTRVSVATASTSSTAASTSTLTTNACCESGSARSRFQIDSGTRPVAASSCEAAARSFRSCCICSSSCERCVTRSDTSRSSCDGCWKNCAALSDESERSIGKSTLSPSRTTETRKSSLPEASVSRSPPRGVSRPRGVTPRPEVPRLDSMSDCCSRPEMEPLRREKRSETAVVIERRRIIGMYSRSAASCRSSSRVAHSSCCVGWSSRVVRAKTETKSGWCSDISGNTSS
eukprot:5236550-Prymnesium_polylepis.1